MSDDNAPLVEFSGLHKAFGGVHAVSDVNLALDAGEVVAVLGHNGAGKSTLMKMLAGAYPIDRGEIRVAGALAHIANPADSQALGIETIHQTLALADNLDAVANLFLGRELMTRWNTMDDYAMEAAAREVFAQLNPNFRNIREPVRSLSGGQRQVVAISRALYFKARVLVMDEPCAALGPEETRMVHDLVRRLKARGVGVFLISHDMPDVFALSDRLAVMKNGRVIGTYRTADLSEDEVLGMIIGGKPVTRVAQQHRMLTAEAGIVNRDGMTLGIDLGTSELKLALVDANGALVASAGAPLTVSRPHPHWAEQSPRDWWQALLVAARALRERHAHAWAGVRAIGLSGQMHGAVLLDADGEPLRPAILWNDTRSAAQCEALTRRLPSLPLIAGNLAMPGFTAPKLLWVAQHEPEVFRRVDRVLLPKDWLRWKLTSAAFSDMSDAAGTLWLDVGRRAWSPQLLAACDMTSAQMPALVEGSDVAGHLKPDAALALGLPEGLPVAGGGGDNAASAVGIGAVQPGDGFLSLGTSGVLFVVTDRFRPNPASAVHAFCHALPGRWHQMSVMLSAANGLQWVTRLLGFENEGALLERVEALTDAQRDRAPLFLPYLSGERTPHDDPHATGVFFGMDNETDAARLGHAVIEGVAFGLADGLQALRDAGTEVRRLALVGGGARSAHWAQLLADVLDIELQTVDGAEAGGAMGAGRLAWLALGHDERDVCRPPAPRALFQPRAARRPALQARLERFRALYVHTRQLTPRD